MHDDVNPSVCVYEMCSPTEKSAATEVISAAQQVALRRRLKASQK